MPTICFVHGVGNHKAGFSKPLSDRVHKATGATVIEHVWYHNSPLPDQPSTGWAMASLRNLTAEIILDFTRSIQDFTNHTNNLPEADMYVGHSAGSIIICGDKNEGKPKVLMGSPMQLVFQETSSKDVKAVRSLLRIGPKTLNLVCQQDVVALNLNMDRVKNFVFPVTFFDVLGRCIPLIAHTKYWDSQLCAQEISKWYLTHFGLPI
jgi:hypothetical protein